MIGCVDNKISNVPAFASVGEVIEKVKAVEELDNTVIPQVPGEGTSELLPHPFVVPPLSDINKKLGKSYPPPEPALPALSL